MRAAGIAEPDGPVRVLSLPDPEAPPPGHVLIDVRSAGVGNWDDLMRVGSWVSGLTPPYALGVEAAGVITAVGAEVADLDVGDEVLGHVFPLVGNGAWAQQLIAVATTMTRKPSAVSWAEAGALPIPALTAYQALHEALGAVRGERLYVHGAGGVTGGVLVQYARALGLIVVATAGAGSRARLEGYGAHTVVDRRDPAWVGQVLAALGGAADIVVNAVPGGSDAALSVVADGGRMTTISGVAPPPERDIAVSSVIVRPDRDQLAELVRLVANGEIVLPIRRSYDLEDAAIALAAIGQGTDGAAVVLTP